MILDDRAHAASLISEYRRIRIYQQHSVTSTETAPATVTANHKVKLIRSVVLGLVENDTEPDSSGLEASP